MESPELSRINIYKYFINIIKYSLVIVVLAEYINLDWPGLAWLGSSRILKNKKSIKIFLLVTE